MQPGEVGVLPDLREAWMMRRIAMTPSTAAAFSRAWPALLEAGRCLSPDYAENSRPRLPLRSGFQERT